jgi:hypothetical protein
MEARHPTFAWTSRDMQSQVFLVAVRGGDDRPRFRSF